MSNVINFAQLRARKLRADTSGHTAEVTSQRAAVLAICDLHLDELDKTELMAAIEDFECYQEADPTIQLLVDIYHALGEQ